jgi:hypothetical protein
MDELGRLLDDLSGRLTGPLTPRWVIQPVMASLLALRDGLADARGHRSPFLRAIVSDPGSRHEAVSSGWSSIAKVFIMALLLDAAYQLLVLNWFYPVEAMLVALVLALVPYAVVRGPISRLLFRNVRSSSRGAVQP